jgi:hypothetical protein
MHTHLVLVLVLYYIEIGTRQMPPNNNIIQCTHTFGIGIILYHIEIGTRQIPPNNNITQCTHTHLVVVLVLCHIETGTRQRAPCSWPH